jgi:tRNA threonylcarbamoyladenosine biosynthesis protein TsaB
MRCILAIDTAGAEGSLALAGDGGVVARDVLPPGGHSEGLSRSVERMLAEARLAARDLAAVAVAEGPGSFTGLRIGLAWAKGFVWATGVPLLLVPSHEALAEGRGMPGRAVASLIPGARGFQDAAIWTAGSPSTLLWGPGPVDESEVVEHLATLAPGPLLIAPLDPRTKATIAEQLEDGGVELAPSAPLAPAIAAIAGRLLVAGRAAEWAAAMPAYGRAPNARKPSR